MPILFLLQVKAIYLYTTTAPVYTINHSGYISLYKITKLLWDTNKMVINCYIHVIDEKEQTQDIAGKVLDF